MIFSVTQPNPPHYKDLLVKICGSYLCAHVIEVLGRDESMLSMMTQAFYYIDVGSGFVIAFIVWSLIGITVKWLDKHFDWNTRTIHRIFLQFFTGILLPAFAVHFLTYLQGVYIIKNSTFFTPAWPKYELPVCIMLIILVNAYYLVYYYYLELKKIKQQQLVTVSAGSPETSQEMGSDASAQSHSIHKKEVILAAKGYKTYPVLVAGIAYFFKEERYTYMITFDNEKYFIDNSLDEIFLWLDDKTFFKANRKTIINIQACRCYSPLAHGKLELFLTPQPDFQILISQKTAPAFKEWMDR